MSFARYLVRGAHRGVGEQAAGEPMLVEARRRFAWVAVCAVVGVAAGSFAGAAPASATDARSLPMTFSLHTQQPAAACQPHCQTWVAAVGAVTSATPQLFTDFSKRHDLHGATVVLDSSGGSVLGALALGRLMRALDVTTTVGHTIDTTAANGKADGSNGAGKAEVSPVADCESMCAFLLLAGTHRYVPPQARVMVHEIWLGDRRDDATAASYTAEDLVVVQRDIGTLARYTIDMGGGGALLETALRIPPWEPMRSLTRAELRSMKLDTETPADADRNADKNASNDETSAQPAPHRVSLAREEGVSEEGWTLKEGARAPSLQRWHPLTVESTEIGGFRIALNCAPTAGTYTVTYRERRALDDSTDGLKMVRLWLSHTVVMLDVLSSQVQPSDGTLLTVARGEMTASAFNDFAEKGSRSLIVSTQRGPFETRIRIGNTGLTQAWPQIAAACGSNATAMRSQQHAELAPTADGQQTKSAHND